MRKIIFIAFLFLYFPFAMSQSKKIIQPQKRGASLVCPSGFIKLEGLNSDAVYSIFRQEYKANSNFVGQKSFDVFDKNFFNKGFQVAFLYRVNSDNKTLKSIFADNYKENDKGNLEAKATLEGFWDASNVDIFSNSIGHTFYSERPEKKSKFGNLIFWRLPMNIHTEDQKPLTVDFDYFGGWEISSKDVRGSVENPDSSDSKLFSNMRCLQNSLQITNLYYLTPSKKKNKYGEFVREEGEDYMILHFFNFPLEPN